MGLVEYKRKRRFQRTSEPAGRRAVKKGRSFVIQKHYASHLHYDFRLELDGVLKSWAVPKGPSLDPDVKRLAVHVEDHPVEYGSFEGTIPEGEYGGGTVMLWDRGDWEPIGDAMEGYRKGRLKFHLYGEKLRGGWMLLRTNRAGAKGDKQQWLLFKERDDEAKPTGDILEEAPLSVDTGLDLDEIANGKKRKRIPKVSSNGKAAAPKRKGRLPATVKVQLATLVKEPPDGNDWLHEIKFDGYRMICRIAKKQVEFVTRNHKNWTKRLPSLAEAAKALPVQQAILDGEVVAMQPDGVTDFQELQNAFRDGQDKPLRYFVFDLLHLDGEDLTSLPLIERKEKLAEIVASLPKSSHIQLSEHIQGDGGEFLKHGCDRSLEGIISKRRDAPYQPGRGLSWLKIKCLKHEEVVIGGFTDPAGSRAGFGALLVGNYNDNHELTYAGKIGTGFDDRLLGSLRKKLESLEQPSSPFKNFRRGGSSTHWVKPKLVAQAKFGSRTREGRLRHASFQGLREDKPAKEVKQDKPIPLDVALRKTTAKTALPNGHAAHGKAETQVLGVRLTSPNKVLYRDQEITKLDLANYYQEFAEWILPHIADRPLSIVRCPDGEGGKCFFQKHPGPGTPDVLRRIRIKEKNKAEEYVVVDDGAGLIALAQIGALELHAWGSRSDKLEQPDRLIFDLDPSPEVSWSTVVHAAKSIRKFLHELELESFVKTTGGKGLHLVVPIDRRHKWDEVKAFCKQVADMIVAADPANYTANMAKAARTGKIFIDYLRNGRGATAIVPYSTRAKPGAPISVPLTWQELNTTIRSDAFTIQNIGKRLSSLRSDPWPGIGKTRQGLVPAMKKLEAFST